MVVSLEALHKTQGGLCCYCGGAMKLGKGRGNSITRDHREPKVLGGGSGRLNISGACRRCNQLKGGLTVSEFKAAYPTANAIELYLPMATFDRQVRARDGRETAAQRAKRLAPVAVNAEKAWGDLMARFSKPVRPLPPPKCRTCRWFGPLGSGCGEVCLLRWASMPFGLTPFVGAGDSCGEWGR